MEGIGVIMGDKVGVDSGGVGVDIGGVEIFVDDGSEVFGH